MPKGRMSVSNLSDQRLAELERQLAAERAKRERLSINDPKISSIAKQILDLAGEYSVEPLDLARTVVVCAFDANHTINAKATRGVRTAKPTSAPKRRGRPRKSKG